MIERKNHMPSGNGNWKISCQSNYKDVKHSRVYSGGPIRTNSPANDKYYPGSYPRILYFSKTVTT
jgi:hypothetical protein